MAKVVSNSIEMLDAVLAHCFSGHSCYAYGQNVVYVIIYEGWNFNSGNYLFTTDTK